MEHTFTDLELVRAARRNDPNSFGELIARHHSTCLRIATYMLRNVAEAEEEVQNACWKAYEHLDQLQGDTEFTGWLCRIVVNRCLVALRVKGRTKMVRLDGDRTGDGAIDLPAVAFDPERELIQRGIVHLLRREIQHLPTLYKNVLVLSDVHQLPLRDVARQLEITLPAAKSRLTRARVELRRRINRYCGPNGYRAQRSRVQAMPAKSTRCPLRSF